MGTNASNEVELYVILSPVGPYLSSGSINLLADPKYVRAWPGGCGFVKMGSNYAPTIAISEMAQKFNCHQALWLYGPEMEITEVGAMNFFAFFHHANGKKELVTPELGKKHALNKYEQFILNTSCFYTMCDFHNFGLIFAGQCTVCLKG